MASLQKLISLQYIKTTVATCCIRLFKQGELGDLFYVAHKHYLFFKTI